MNRASSAPSSARRRTGLRLARLGVVLAAVATTGLAPLGLVPSSADTAGDKKKIDASIAQLRISLEDTSEDLARAFVQLQRTRALLPGARRALSAAQAAQAVADRYREAVVMALAVARANESRATSTLLQNARATQKVQDQIGNLARDDYQRGGVSGLSIVLEADSPEDFTNRMIMMDTMMRVREATLRDLATMRAEGIAVRAHLVAVRRQVASLKTQAEAALARATATRETAAAAKTRLDLLSAAQTRYAARVAAKKAAEIASLNRMKARSDTLAAVLAARARAARAAAARARNGGVQQSRGSGFLRFPVAAPTSSEFGIRVHPLLRVLRMHEGLDFTSGCGSPVYAAAAGDVIMATPESMAGGYGNQLVIDHGLQRGGVDLTTTYSHLAGFVVTGGRVNAGQLVAYAGTTGTSTGCHLHFETREDGVPVNPRLWL